MFVYRFQYSKTKGIYNSNRYGHKVHLVTDALIFMDNTYAIHPSFNLPINKKLVFGFDSISKFTKWFPEQLLKEIIRIKPKSLKFCVYDVNKNKVVSDANQCQFDSINSKMIIRCNMNCVNL